MKDYLFYHDLSGKRRLRPFVRAAVIVAVVMGLLAAYAVTVRWREGQKRVLPAPTPVLAVAVPTDTPRPTATATPPRPACPPPAAWRLKPVLVPEEGAPEGQPPVYGLEPACAYDALYRSLLYNFLLVRGYTRAELNRMLGAPSDLSSIMDPHEALAGQYPPYNEWPREIEVPGADGRPRKVEVLYGNWVDYRLWSKRAFYAAPSYCAPLPEGTEIPLRGQPALVACALKWLGALSGRDLMHVEAEGKAWTIFSVDRGEEPEVLLLYFFVDPEGNAFKVASRRLEDTSVEQAVAELSGLGLLHGTGVWFFGDAHPNLPPPGAFTAPVVDWRERAPLFGAPLEEYPRPEGWEEAPVSENAPQELTDYVVEVRNRIIKGEGSP